MALSINEGTKQRTMELLSEMVCAPIVYARIFSHYVTRDNHPGGAFACMLDCFLHDNPASDMKAPLHYEIGCSLPPSAIDAMASNDDRAVLYKHIEYIINYTSAEHRRNDNPNKFDATAENAALRSLSNELGIETLFLFQEETPSDEE